jgi:hypothetical protein
MNKKGQVAIFVIVAVLVVAGILIYFFAGQDSNDVPTDSFADEVNLRVQNCLDNSLSLTLQINSLNGGYFSNETHYYFENEVSNIPSKSDLEGQLISGVETIFPSCLDFSDLSVDVRYDIERFNPLIEIEDGSVNLNVNFIINVNEGETSYVLDEFESEIETDYLRFYDVAVELTEEQEKHPDEICLTCAGRIAEENRVSITSMEGQREGYEILFYIITSERDDPSFLFKHKFRLENE